MSKGAHCVIINAKLIVSKCPIDSCTWQHLTTKVCKYNPEFADRMPKPHQIARLVGGTPPSAEEVANITNLIKHQFINETR